MPRAMMRVAPDDLYEKSSSEGQARQKWVRKRSLRAVNEHSEPIFNEASPSAGTFRTEPRALILFLRILCA